MLEQGKAGNGGCNLNGVFGSEGIPPPSSTVFGRKLHPIHALLFAAFVLILLTVLFVFILIVTGEMSQVVLTLITDVVALVIGALFGSKLVE